MTLLSFSGSSSTAGSEEFGLSLSLLIFELLVSIWFVPQKILIYIPEKSVGSHQDPWLLVPLGYSQNGSRLDGSGSSSKILFTQCSVEHRDSTRVSEYNRQGTTVFLGQAVNF